MIIRKAGPEDASALDSLLTKLIQDESFYDANLNGAYVVKENYAARLEMDGHAAFVAEDSGKIVGYAYGYVLKIPDMLWHPVAVLDALFVDEAYRRRGAAKKLFSAFQKYAEENEACSIELKVLSRNEKALSLYRALGFLETKKVMSLKIPKGNEDA